MYQERERGILLCNLVSTEQHHSCYTYVETSVAYSSPVIYLCVKSTQPRLSPRLLRAKSAGTVKKTVTRRIPKSAGVSRGTREPGECGN